MRRRGTSEADARALVLLGRQVQIVNAAVLTAHSRRPSALSWTHVSP